jgi:hypothetical protein
VVLGIWSRGLQRRRRTLPGRGAADPGFQIHLKFAFFSNGGISAC